MDELPTLCFNYNRRFGVEIELNAFDGRDFKARPLGPRELPAGIHYIGNLISKKLKTPVNVGGWHLTHNNQSWEVKPDRSCGIEVCSPATRGWAGLKQVLEVIEEIRKNPTTRLDQRCSLHVHVDVSDCLGQVANIMAYWIKSEAVFLDSVPECRKRNQYCRPIGQTNLFQHDSKIESDQIIKKLSQKYLTANTYHLNKGNRNTIEFRIAEHEGCIDANFAKNWIRLILHFVEMTRIRSLPIAYRDGDPWSSFLWLEPKDVMYLLGFYGNYDLSPGMVQTRNWFLQRLAKNIDAELPGVWSKDARAFSKKQVLEIIKDLGNIEVNDSDPIFSETLKF